MSTERRTVDRALSSAHEPAHSFYFLLALALILGGGLTTSLVALAQGPQGYLDHAVNASNGTTTVPQNGQLLVSGWAQAQGTATLSRVAVTIDGNPIGNAMLGPGTSWSLTYNIGNLSGGSHWASATAYDSNNASTTLSWSSGTAGSFTVVTAAGPPQGYLNSAVNASNGTTSVPQNGQLLVSGWAAAQGTATLSKVVVTVDGNPIGNATLGPGTSWSLTYNIGTLSGGSHWASAVAYDSNNASTTLSWSSAGAGSFTVVTAAGPPQGYLNSAVNASDGTTSVPQNGQLQVSGWAQAQGTATLSKVVVTIDGNPIGNATLGPGTSWSLTYNIGTLSAGSHWASAVAYDSNNASTTLSWSSAGAGSFTVTASFPSSSHVFVVMEENQSFSQVFPSGSATNCSSAGMPYLCSLAAANGMALNFYANQHGSLLEYLYNTSGADWTGSPYDCNGAGCASLGVITGDNIVPALQVAGKTWRGYFEDMPFQGYMGADTANYVQRHNPFVWYADVANSTAEQNNMYPFTQFAQDVNAGTFQNFSYIVPNLLDDAGGTGSQTASALLLAADNWLETNISPLLSTPAFQPGGDGILIVVFDEGDVAGESGDSTADNSCSPTQSSGCGGHVAFVMIGPNVMPASTTSNTYHFQDMLHTIIHLLGMTDYMNNASQGSDIALLPGVQ